MGQLRQGKSPTCQAHNDKILRHASPPLIHTVRAIRPAAIPDLLCHQSLPYPVLQDRGNNAQGCFLSWYADYCLLSNVQYKKPHVPCTSFQVGLKSTLPLYG